MAATANDSTPIEANSARGAASPVRRWRVAHAEQAAEHGQDDELHPDLRIVQLDAAGHGAASASAVTSERNKP